MLGVGRARDHQILGNGESHRRRNRDNSELFAEDRDDRAQVREADLFGTVLAEVAGFDELAPVDGVGAAAFLADDRRVRAPQVLGES